MKKKFPKSFITLIALITVFTGVVTGVHATENTNELTTSVFSDESISDTSESSTSAETTKRTTTTQTSYPQVSLELSTNSTSYNPTTLPPVTTFTQPQTEPVSYVSPLGGYGDGWGHITRVYKIEVNPYTQGHVPTGLPSTTNYEGYPVCAMCGEDAWWQLNTQTGEMRIYGEGEIYNMEVPQWWDSRDYIKKVVISDDITNISFFAFADCSQLTEVVIGNSVETIGAFAFSECVNLKSVVIPDSVKSIDSMAFYGCTSLESITMSGNIEHLGRNTFTDSGYYNNPENWEDGVLYIGNCLVDTEYESLWEVESYTIKEGTRVIAAGAFMNSFAESVIIPESVVEIGECAFRGTNIKTIEIPQGTKTICKAAFDFCHNLESIYIPASVEVIEEDAFQGCTALTQITVDENNENFVVDDGGALYNLDKSLLIRFPSQKDIETYTVHENAREIADYAFENSQINNINLNDGLERIGLCAFKGCYNLESIVIPDSVNWIENYAFVWCDSLKTVDLGNASVSHDIFDFENNIEYLTLDAGFSSDIYYLNLNSSIKSITVSPDNECYSSDEYGVLYNKDKTVLYKYTAADERTSYEIPYGVQTIYDSAFSEATNLSEITLPASLTFINDYAFYECSSLRDVYYTGSEEDWGYVYIGFPSLEYIGTPICLDTEEAPEHPEPSDPSWWDETTTWIYEDTTHNGEDSSSVVTTAPTTTMPYDEEYGTYGVLRYVINNGEVTITDCDESASNELVIPDEIDGYPVTKIRDYAFEGCENLTDIYFCGTQDEWNAIEIQEEGNTPLYNATVHYNIHSVASVSAENVAANCGETVSVPVKIVGNPGFMGFSLIMEYDKTAMTPVSVTAGEMLGNGTFNNSIGGTMSDGRLKVVYTAGENVTEDGTLFTVEFEVDEEAYGDYDIKISYIQNDTFDENFEDVELGCRDLMVTVVDPSEEGKAKFFIDPMQVDAGDEIIVLVHVYVGCEALSGFELTLDYNSDIFCFNEIMSDMNIDEFTVDDENGTISLSIGGMYIHNDICDVAAYVSFNVTDYIETKETIYVSCDGAYYDGIEMESVCRNGEITIANPHADEPAIIYADERVSVSDGYVDIPVYINNNHGIMGFGMNISYDSTVLEPVSATKGTVISNGSFDNNIGNVSDGIKIIWNSTENINDNGLLFTVRFKILDEENLDVLPLAFSYSQADTYNENWEDVVLNIDIGAISISQEYTAQFIADGVVVSTQKFTADTESLDEPEIPQKAGYVARWDYYEIKEEDMIINAKYDLPAALMVAKRTLKADDTVRLLPSCNFETTRKNWSSSNASVAIVDNRGNVTAVGEGKCTIKVTCYGVDSFGNEIKASASTQIVVNKKTEPQDLKQKFRDAFDEFFEVILHDLMENLKKFMIVLFRYAY